MSLGKRIQREIKTNPAKAGGLAVLLLVAGYFWAPLVAGFFKTEEGAVATQGAAPAPLPVGTAPTLVPAGQAVPSEPPRFEWRKFSKAIDDDARMTPTGELPSDRDPFAGQKIEAPPTPEPQTKAPPVAEQRVTPDDVGLVLSTTLLGAHKRIAEIGGKSYKVGDRVEISQGAVQASFRVIEIHTRRVVLESAGERFELTMPRPLVDSVAEGPGGDLPPPTAHAERPETNEEDPKQVKTGDERAPGDDPGSATE